MNKKKKKRRKETCARAKNNRRFQARTIAHVTRKKEKMKNDAGKPTLMVKKKARITIEKEATADFLD
jgi:hypothetical protein